MKKLKKKEELQLKLSFRLQFVIRMWDHSI